MAPDLLKKIGTKNNAPLDEWLHASNLYPYHPGPHLPYLRADATPAQNLVKFKMNSFWGTPMKNDK
jgi:hypothetical protein